MVGTTLQRCVRLTTRPVAHAPQRAPAGASSWATRLAAALCALAGALPSACSPRPEDGGDAEFPAVDAFGRLAQDIVLEGVSIDQGVSLDYVAGGAAVDDAGRGTVAIAGRDTLLRALWRLEDGFEPRELRLHVELARADGTIEDATQTVFIDADSDPRWPESGLALVVPGAWIEPDLALSLGIYELEGVDGPQTMQSPPRYPEPGFAHAPVDIADGGRRIELVVVPIIHDYDVGKVCEGEPVLGEYELTRMRESLHAMNPVTEVIVVKRDEPLIWSESAADLGAILDALSALRVVDGAPPWVYYFGAIDPCDWGSDEGYAGLAYVPREITVQEAWRRVSVGEFKPSMLARALSTFVHEIGHNQGRKHVPCTGTELNTVTDYPHDMGATSTYGFDIVRWVLHAPNAADYMTYCDPAWIGPYGWNQVLPVIETLTGWSEAADALEPDGLTVVISEYQDGSRRAHLWPRERLAGPTRGARGGQTLLAPEAVRTRAGRVRLVDGRVRPLAFEEDRRMRQEGAPVHFVAHWSDADARDAEILAIELDGDESGALPWAAERAAIVAPTPRIRSR